VWSSVAAAHKAWRNLHAHCITTGLQVLEDVQRSFSVVAPSPANARANSLSPMRTAARTASPTAWGCFRMCGRGSAWWRPPLPLQMPKQPHKCPSKQSTHAPKQPTHAHCSENGITNGLEVFQDVQKGQCVVASNNDQDVRVFQAEGDFKCVFFNLSYVASACVQGACVCMCMCMCMCMCVHACVPSPFHCTHPP